MKSQDQIIQEFKEAVNMTSRELQDWLKTEESKNVGQKPVGEEVSIGHHAGEKIVKLLQKKEEAYTKEDASHMQRVVSYVHRHLAQGPTVHSIENSRWRYSLMNWGHDPLKE